VARVRTPGGGGLHPQNPRPGQSRTEPGVGWGDAGFLGDSGPRTPSYEDWMRSATTPEEAAYPREARRPPSRDAGNGRTPRPNPRSAGPETSKVSVGGGWR